MNSGPSACLGCHRERLHFVCVSPKGMPSGPGGVIDWGSLRGLACSPPSPHLHYEQMENRCWAPSSAQLLGPLYLKINNRLKVREVREDGYKSPKCS